MAAAAATDGTVETEARSADGTVDAQVEAADGTVGSDVTADGTPSATRLVAGRYRLLEPLGRGGMGRVYRGVDDLLDRPVAVKLIYDDAVSDRDLRRACAVEARAAARLSHPGIVRILDSGFDDGHCFVVMELAEGDTLAEILHADGALPIERALGFAAQVADALEAAHREGVVHCDIKPGNLMVDTFERIRLVDFGIARVANSTTSRLDGDIQGSAKYVAPEQVEGATIDARTDLYALGVVLYEMLAGQPPFSGGNLASILAQRLVADPPRLRGLRADVPPRVEQIVRRAMERDPNRRYQTARELRDALRAARHEAVAATAMPFGEIAASTRRWQHRLAWVREGVGSGAIRAARSAVRSSRRLGAALTAAFPWIAAGPGQAWPTRWPSLGTGIALATLIGLLVGVAAAQCGTASVATEAALASQPATAPAPAAEDVAPTLIPAPAVAAAPTDVPAPPTPIVPPPTATVASAQRAPAPPVQVLVAPPPASAPAQEVDSSGSHDGDRPEPKAHSEPPGAQPAARQPDEKPGEMKPAVPAPAEKPQGPSRVEMKKPEPAPPSSHGNQPPGRNGNQKKR